MVIEINHVSTLEWRVSSPVVAQTNNHLSARDTKINKNLLILRPYWDNMVAVHNVLGPYCCSNAEITQWKHCEKLEESSQNAAVSSSGRRTV